jgi:hypothetical protein
VFLFLLLAGLWTALTLGMANKTEPQEEIIDTLIANQSLLLILILTNHCTSDQGLPNPYRQALNSFTNSQGRYGVVLLPGFNALLPQLVFLPGFQKGRDIKAS